MTTQAPKPLPSEAKTKLDKAIWQDPALTQALSQIAAEPVQQKVNPGETCRSTESNRKWHVSPLYAMAASLVVCVLTAGLWWYQPSVDVPAPSTPVAKLARYTADAPRQLQLSDGSQVSLNRDSLLTYIERDNQRESMLLSGEAFFDVARNERKPFTVNIGDALVTVLGTRFNINRSPDKTWIDVYHGRVAVTLGEKQLILTQGQRAVVSAGDLEAKTFVAEQPGWQQGWLDFDELGLQDAAFMLSRYSDKPVVLGRIDHQLTISGRFKATDTAATLSLISELYPVEFEEFPDSYLMRSASVSEP